MGIGVWKMVFASLVGETFQHIELGAPISCILAKFVLLEVIQRTAVIDPITSLVNIHLQRAKNR
jgi:hypothetical protein